MKVYPIAVSSKFKPADYEAGREALVAQGAQFLKEPVVRRAESQFVDLNGSDTERLGELCEAFESGADLLWAVRGGYGMTRLLPDLQLIDPKPVLAGFSDTTALMLHLWARFNHKSLHASTLTRLPLEPQESFEALQMILKGRAKQVAYPCFASPFKQSELTGVIIPVNLFMLRHLVGTPSMPDLTGCLLILEEVTESPYKIDGMLTQLAASGVLNGVQAMVVGHLTDCGESALDVFKERCAAFKIPCFTGFQMGHESPNWPVPFGVLGRIKSNAGEACLQILEELF